MERFSKYKSVQEVLIRKIPNRFTRLMVLFFLFIFIIMLLPWTQSITSYGYITALQPNNRPQTVHTIIAGRIEKWYVQEGDYVQKGDTLVNISEVKTDYMDPNLINRTAEQIQAKENANMSYEQKINFITSQIKAMTENQEVKLKQTKNKIKQIKYKITSDSMDYQANIKQLKIAQMQYERFEVLFNDGLKSQTELENRRVKLQEMQAKVIGLENKLLVSKNEYLNAIADLTGIQTEFNDKIAKSNAEIQSTRTLLYGTQSDIAKMKNQQKNYEIRSGYYYITAPQNGYITKALISGIGETIKEGTPILSIVPNLSDFAVETYISAMDLPLTHKGSHVRLQFDGWPAIVFSGWPNVSHGTYEGTIQAIDNYISPNGKYRVLIVPDHKNYPWPKGLKMGVSVRSMALLNDVPIWYELWRNINGFPPNYYTGENNNSQKSKK